MTTSVRTGSYVDPKGSRIKFGDWAPRWLAAKVNMETMSLGGVRAVSIMCHPHENAPPSPVPDPIPVLALEPSPQAEPGPNGTVIQRSAPPQELRQYIVVRAQATDIDSRDG
ncbi:hypothetical protein [uncultured Jatrophihabitans sp.]|uniref:hypothetical protein n=1 Tax=uncultured Jatrophihabitans sp. TaxID=1610747 RepID=UPI0035CB8F22